MMHLTCALGSEIKLILVAEDDKWATFFLPGAGLLNMRIMRGVMIILKNLKR